MGFFRTVGIVVGTVALVLVFISFVIQGLNVLFKGQGDNPPTSGPTTLNQGSYSNPLLSRAEPYTSKIITDNLELRKFATSITEDCPSGDKECQVTKVYRYVVDNYHYYSDPRSKELIQSPFETIEVKGGDCEDFAVLMNSLLENIGFKTYIILTDNHAYGLVCGVNPNEMFKYVNADLLKSIVKNGELQDGEIVYKSDQVYLIQKYKKNYVIEPNSLQYFGGNGSSIKTPFINKGFVYSYSFSSPVDFYVVSGEGEYQSLVDGKSFRAFDCTEKNALTVDGKCERIGTDGGIVIVNQDSKRVIVSMNLEVSYLYSQESLLNNVTITSYNLKNNTCVVLDGTMGTYGYPGLNPTDMKGDKFAFDPITKEIETLK